MIEAKEMIMPPRDPKENQGHECCQTVVILDLCHFTQIIRSLEITQRIGPVAAKVVQDQIEEMVRIALHQSGNAWERCFIKRTGDGAVLCFPSALAADQFAEALLIHADEDYNRHATHDLEHRCFRVGIYTGNVIRTARDVAGAAVAFAARLESAADTSEILIDADSWSTLPSQAKDKYGPEEKVDGKQHDGTLLLRRRRVGMRAPWDTSKATEATSTRTDNSNGSGLAALRAILNELSRADRTTGVAEPPGNLGQALSEGKEKVTRLMSNLAGEALNRLTLDHIEAVISEAISHGAGIYNHSSRGRVGCGEIYFLAATGLLELGVHELTASDAIPSDASLALSWLKPIVKSTGRVTSKNGDDVAWELRFCYDSIPLVPRCDQVTMVLRDIARRNDALLIPRIVRQVVEKSRGLPPHVSAYELRHAVRVLLWLCENEEFKDWKFRRVVPILRKLDESSARIVMQNAQHLQRELATGLIDCCAKIERIEPSGNGDEERVQNFGNWAAGDHVTLAIVFTDIVGSAAMENEFGDEHMEEVRSQHFSQGRELLKKHNGREIKTMGDAIMAAFKSVAAALDFAREFQVTPGHPELRVRAGIHIGPVRVKANDVHGSTVNFAARVVAAIGGAEIWLSNQAMNDLNQLRARRHRVLNWLAHKEVKMNGFPGSYTLWSLTDVGTVQDL